MTATWIQHAFQPLKTYTPSFVWRPLRSVATAVLTPIRFSYRSGHLRSSLRNLAVDRQGRAIPWYTYPAIDFLSSRSFAGKRVLEFGAGQSTLWWASRAKDVVSVEQDADWHERLLDTCPANVALAHIPVDRSTWTIEPVRRFLDEHHPGLFDVVIIDGHLREQLVPLAFERLAPSGGVIVDNAAGYFIYEATRDMACARVDFIGYSPGVVLPQCTCVFFRESCFLLAPSIPVPNAEL